MDTELWNKKCQAVRIGQAGHTKGKGPDVGLFTIIIIGSEDEVLGDGQQGTPKSCPGSVEPSIFLPKGADLKRMAVVENAYSTPVMLGISEAKTALPLSSTAEQQPAFRAPSNTVYLLLCWEL